jgi:hypothetical protein
MFLHTVLSTFWLKLELNYGRQSIGQSVLVSGAHLGPATNFYFSLKYSLRQLLVCYFIAPSLTRGRVFNLLYSYFWALPEQSLLGGSPTELTAIFYCLVWDSPNLEGQVPVFISSRNRVAQLYPRHCVPFLSPLTARRAVTNFISQNIRMSLNIDQLDF